MVSLRMMGWGLVLLENSSAVAVAAVTAAYLENITTHLHFRYFGHSQKGCLSGKQNGKLKNDFLVTTFQNDIKKCLHTKVLRRGLDGSWLVGF